MEDRRLLATISLSPISDATLYEDNSGDPANGAGQNLFAGVTANRNQNQLRRGLLQFDVASAIPAGATIDAVTLQLTVNRVPGGAPSANMSLHEVLADWGEGTTDAGGQEGRGQSPPSTNSATWRHRFFSSSTWATPGGDFDTSASATALVAGLGSYQWTGGGLVADVQQWLDTPSTQFGWLLKADDESASAGRNAKRFAARENPNQSARPLLTIEFTDATNQAPTLDPISNPAAILEDAGQQTLNLSGISAGAGETQGLTVTATSSNPALIPTPTVNYASPNSTGTLAYTPEAHQFGSSVITVTVMDDGGTAGGGVDTVIRQFTVTVNPVNDAPTLNSISNPSAITEDSAQQVINLSGISAGPNEVQNLTVTAVSNNPSLIPNPSVDYTSPNATATLSYTPVANQFGTAQITVTVTDNGGTSGGGSNTISRVFTVTVNPVNDAPTLDPIADLPSVPENSGAQNIDLTGISAGPSETQTLTITATSNNPQLIANPGVDFNSGNSTGTLSFTPQANTTGSVIITIRVMDDGGTENGGVDVFTRSFTVTVVDVNQPPTLDAIDNPAAIPEDSPEQTISLTGIGAGPGELQSLIVTAVSDNPGVVPNPTVDYTSPNVTGALRFTAVADRSGEAVIVVTVRDDGGTDNGGIDEFTRTFTVTVDPVNDAPTLQEIANPQEVDEDAGRQTVSLDGIMPGGDESQPLRVSVVSDAPELIPDPTVNYTSPESTGSFDFTPAANQFGTAILTVTVEDGGLDGQLATSGDNGTTTQSLTVTVLPINDPPTLDPVPDLEVNENAGEQNIALSGITAGGGESQPLRIEVESSDESIVPSPNVDYTSPNSAGNLRFTPQPNAVGSATVTVTVIDGGLDGDLATLQDNGETRVSFSVRVGVVNAPPALDAIGDQTVDEDSSEQVLVLSGITAGDGEDQALRLTVTSANPGLIPEPALDYTSPQDNGELRFSPAPDQNGSTTLTVTVEDAGPDGDFDTTSDNASLSRTFSVTVTPINDPPVAAEDTLTVQQDTSTVLDLLDNDADIDSAIATDSFEFRNGPTQGLVSLNAGVVSYTPTPGFFGSDSFSYRVADVEGDFSDFVTVDVTVNAAPTANDLQAFISATTPTEVSPAIGDPDGEVQNLQIEILTNPDPAVGQIEVVGGSQIRFTPGASLDGSLRIDYQVRDAGGGVSPVAELLLGVYNQNPTLAEDVNGSGEVSSIDALLTINTLNIEGGREIPPGDNSQPFYDVNADGFVSPIDALIVINFLNNRPGRGEGELGSEEAVDFSSLARSGSNEPESVLELAEDPLLGGDAIATDTVHPALVDQAHIDLFTDYRSEPTPPEVPNETIELVLDGHLKSKLALQAT